MEPITEAFARHFAQEWIDAWNAHDLDRILSHYDDAFVMHSPMIARIAGEPSGCLHGKAAVRAYWAKALQLIPDLRFEFIAVLAGVDSVAIHYRGANGRGAVEVFRFGAGNRVNEAFAHYAA
ncbi:nuclear transport factor 2 family protein [Burkholderia sp. PR2]|uniref:nuclear transport factor 2 family protein n=1 Tax=Burkholderia sp. PR2 TaxID=3448078 RepID=UPI00402A90F1